MKYKTYNHKAKKPLKITKEVREEIRVFKQRLMEMASQPDETSAFDARTIHLIMNELDDYNRNILLAYYSVAGCSATALANLFGVSPTVIYTRLRRITNAIRKSNHEKKTYLNQPRIQIDY